MRIALYVCPYVLSKSSIYQVYVLIDNLKKNYNYNVDLFVSDSSKLNNNNETDIINKQYVRDNNLNIIWSEPNSKKYDILLLTNVFSKIWNTNDARIAIAKSFIKYKKPVFSLKYDTTLEHRYINLPEIIYGVNTKYILPINNKWIITDKCKKFIFPSLNFCIPKPNCISKKDFYKIYNLNPKLKIIIFFIGRNKKWQHIYNDYTLSIHWFLKNIITINNILNKYGYQLIFKFHRNETNNNHNNLTIINSEHTYESIHYSTYAFTYGTSMVYQLYLYNLPSLEIGHGMYFPGWTVIHKYINTKLPSCFNYGQDLIYGNICSYDSLSNNTINTLLSFLNTTHDLTKFKYINDNPIYGNSYYYNINDITKSLHTQIQK